MSEAQQKSIYCVRIGRRLVSVKRLVILVAAVALVAWFVGSAPDVLLPVAP